MLFSLVDNFFSQLPYHLLTLSPGEGVMNFNSNQLSLEQEFIHQVFATKVKDLSDEETKDLLIKFHKQMLFKDNLYQKLSSQEKNLTINY